MKILVIDDDRGTADMVRLGLSADAHTVEIANDGAEGSFLARTYEYDAIILDYSMPKKDGLIVCGEIRGAGRQTPILFLSVTDDVPLKVAAFESGADDYITKPFSIEELRARVKAIGRRPEKEKRTTMKIDDLVLDPETQTVLRGKSRLYLTKKEFNLLEYLMRNQGTILSRPMIMEHVWTADSDPLSNTVETHIRNLRHKINTKNKPNIIANVQGRGYVIDSPENLKHFAVSKY